jgi:hypothetical protein
MGAPFYCSDKASWYAFWVAEAMLGRLLIEQ